MEAALARGKQPPFKERWFTNRRLSSAVLATAIILGGRFGKRPSLGYWAVLESKSRIENPIWTVGEFDRLEEVFLQMPREDLPIFELEHRLVTQLREHPRSIIQA